MIQKVRDNGASDSLVGEEGEEEDVGEEGAFDDLVLIVGRSVKAKARG